ncbi:MAG: methyltransferase domain-containing protein [Verrucomicrobiota bacterium]
MIVSVANISEAEVGQHYDQLNDFYLDVWGRHRHHGFWSSGRESAEEAIALMTHRIEQAIQLERGGKVVDVGCGTGGMSWDLVRQKEAEVVAYTLSIEEKKYAESGADNGGESGERGKARFICGDWLENDLPDHWADAVMVIESFSHMEDRQAAMAEAVRVLKPGGRLLLADWVASQSPTQWQVKRLLQPMCRGGRLTGLNSLGENRELLESLQLQVLRAEDITASVEKTWWVIAWRLLKKGLSDGLYRKFIWQSFWADREVFFAIPRVILAYRLGCLRYGWLVAQKDS